MVLKMREDDIKKTVSAGQKYGRWTILNDYIKNARGEKKWLCRCDCGTERYVLERGLRSGSSKSCGCMTRENAKKALSYDLTGQTFGDLTVINKIEGEHKYRGVMWHCQCSCGNTYDVLSTLLRTGKRTHCGDKKAHKDKMNYAYANIAGQRFHKLTALYPTNKRGNGGSVVWFCRCDCGNEVEIGYNELMWGNWKSCGCLKKKHNLQLKDYQTRAAGTSIDVIKSKKVPRDNTSGYRGVGFTRGRYFAKIVFQRKQYYLGAYKDIEDAVKARKEAETLLFDKTAAYYDRWEAKATSDPAWAEANPVQIRVIKDAVKGLTVSYSPEL